MKLLILFFLLTLGSCSHSAPTHSPLLQVLYKNRIGNGNTMYYEYFVVVTNYDTAYFKEFNFPYLASKYVANSPAQSPVGIVTFLRPRSRESFDIHEPDISLLYKYRISSIILKQ